MIIDNITMQMVNTLHQFDVLIASNLYRNIIDNIACGLAGGVVIY